MAKRRANHEGSIYQRKDKRWVAAAYVNGERRAFYGRTREEAADKLTRALAAELDGRPVPREQLTVKRFLEDWLQAKKAGVRPATYASYTDIVNLHLVPELGRHKLARLQPDHVESMIAKKRKEGLSPRRLQYIRAVLRNALARAVKTDKASRNVAALTEAPKQVRREIRPLSNEHARTLLAAAAGDRLGPLYVVAIATGMRQGELLGSRWEDIDLDGGVIHVRYALQRVEGAFTLVEPKTDRSRRTLPLPRVAANAIRAHKARQNEERLKAGPYWQDEWGLVFTTAYGAPLDATRVTHGFQKLLEAHQLPRARFHDLRHSYASLLIQRLASQAGASKDVSLRMVMEMLGHSQISLTANLYTHIADAVKRDTADLMDAALGGL